MSVFTADSAGLFSGTTFLGLIIGSLGFVGDTVGSVDFAGETDVVLDLLVPGWEGFDALALLSFGTRVFIFGIGPSILPWSLDGAEITGRSSVSETATLQKKSIINLVLNYQWDCLQVHI
jgi:hypothetical protein